MGTEFEKMMNYNKRTRKQVVEENENNVKKSREQLKTILDKAYKSQKVKSKESANDDKQIFTLKLQLVLFGREDIIRCSSRYVFEFLILWLDDEGTLCFIVSVPQFDKSVESEILICLFSLHVCLLKPQENSYCMGKLAHIRCFLLCYQCLMQEEKKI